MCGEDAEGVGQQVIDEPDDGDHEQTEPVVPQDQEVWIFGHFSTVVLLGFLELGSDDEHEGGQYSSDAEGDAPGGSQVLLGGSQDHDHGHQGAGHEADIQLEVGREDEPAVSCSGFQLGCGFGGCDTACGVLTTNTDADQHAVGSQRSGHSVEGAAAIGTSAEGSEDDHDSGRHHKGVLPGPVVAKETEEELANDGADESEGSQVGARRGVGEVGAIDLSEEGCARTNDLW